MDLVDTPPQTQQDHQPERLAQSDLTAVMREAMMPIMSPLLARLEALEKLSMPPPPTPPARVDTTPHTAPTGAARGRPPMRTAGAGQLTTQPVAAQDSWTTVTCLGQGRKRKLKGNSDYQEGGPLAQINLTPASFANVVAKAAHLPQSGGGQVAPQNPVVTKITVLHFGGLLDPAVETAI